jgi:hypothetical protein
MFKYLDSWTRNVSRVALRSASAGTDWLPALKVLDQSKDYGGLILCGFLKAVITDFFSETAEP